MSICDTCDIKDDFTCKYCVFRKERGDIKEFNEKRPLENKLLK